MNEILWITQMQDDGNDIEITEMECPAGMFARLRDRIFPYSHDVPLETGAVLITLKYMNGDLTDDDPLCIADHHGYWVLHDYFKAPKRVWKKIVLEVPV
jgi:hypothetical protein